ncbi:MAG: hypothetical protein GWO02_18660 [Gammaproteobacteria bacterium]|nr:hypothetical protein [Gammaproteobacteria bacterium]
MPPGVLGLVGAYLALAALLLILNLYARLHWLIKAGAVVLVLGFFVTGYWALYAALGWPTARPLPERFRFVAADIREPLQADDGEGAIYVWATDLSRRAGRTAPRAYALPYSVVLHRHVQEAMARTRDGHPQMGEVKVRTGLLWRVLGRTVAASAYEKGLRFRELPSPTLPPK